MLTVLATTILLFNIKNNVVIITKLNIVKCVYIFMCNIINSIDIMVINQCQISITL
jgi:hypothetical protein